MVTLLNIVEQEATDLETDETYEKHKQLFRFSMENVNNFYNK